SAAVATAFTLRTTSPSGDRTRSPSRRIASRCAPRATSTTGIPAAWSRAPIEPPTAPAPRITHRTPDLPSSPADHHLERDLSAPQPASGAEGAPGTVDDLLPADHPRPAAAAGVPDPGGSVLLVQPERRAGHRGVSDPQIDVPPSPHGEGPVRQR